MNKLSFISMLTLTGFWFSACKPEPGLGGLAQISGVVQETDYNNAGVPQSTYLKVDQRVYIRYGDNLGIDDDTRTAFDGTFKFEHLQAGSYTVFTFGECNNCPSGSETVLQSVALSLKEHKTLDTIHVSKY